MKVHYPYLIVGGGMAADAAVRGIRKIDTLNPIGLIGDEADPPYNRPPLSKGLWKRTPRAMPLSRIFRQTNAMGVDLMLGRTVTRVSPAEKHVLDDQGNEFTYEKLLLATGGSPIRIPLDPESPLLAERVIFFRTLADYRRLRSLTETCQDFAIIGGGFIGSEMAAVLAAQGKKVTLVFPETGICARAFPAPISDYLNRFFQERGVRVITGQWVRQVATEGNRILVHTDQETFSVDVVVAGLGIRPNETLAQTAGLTVRNGIWVDEFLRTSQADIFSAGDVINFYNPQLDQRLRVEHEENANISGQFAGQGMAGELERYDILPSVYSTLFDLNYDAVGELNPALETYFDWQEPFQKGVVYYLRENRVRGVLLWNLNHGLEAARQWIAAQEPVQFSDLKGQIRD
jgi:NADPH-dependent 2,4-dienoyl-CoA reductase/sulfur reductase-like enzyme